MELFWATENLAVATRPRGGDWLVGDLAHLQSSGVAVLVSCLMADEEAALELQREASEAERLGLVFLRLRAPDRGVPSDEVAARAVLQRLRALAAEGRRIAVHCRMGLGRSPMVVAAALIEGGMEPGEAWAAVEATRGRQVPDTDVQRMWSARVGQGDRRVDPSHALR